MENLQKRYRYEYASNRREEPFEIADITITVQGSVSAVVHLALALVTDALATFALRTCEECHTATPCECGREEGNSFQLALYDSGNTLWEV